MVASFSARAILSTIAGESCDSLIFFPLAPWAVWCIRIALAHALAGDTEDSLRDCGIASDHPCSEIREEA